MKHIVTFIMLLMIPYISYGQVQNDADGNFDSTTYVETNTTTGTTYIGTNTSTSTNTNNNTNVNTNTNLNTNNTTINATNTNLNTNNTTVNSTATNTNLNTNNTTINATNTNTNLNTNNTTITATNNNTNSNTNVNTSTSTATNTNVNTNNSIVESTSTATNTNISTSVSESTAENTNKNINDSVSVSTNNNINQNNNVNENRSVSESNQTQYIEQKIDSPPPSAIAPSIGASFSQDLCTTGVSGAVQTQIFGISGGKSITDTNCERIKLAKTIYDMGMRVAAVSLMCQDDRVWTAMKMAGTPCPYQGLIGDEAGLAWEENLADVPGIKEKDVERGRVTESPNRPR